MVGHVGRGLEGEFDEAADEAVFAPGGLVDEFVDVLLFDGVYIRATVFNEPADDGAGVLVVAGDHGFSPDVTVDGDGFLVLVEDKAVGVADRYGAVDFLEIVEVHNLEEEK